jgi:hypothetical protein
MFKCVHFSVLCVLGVSISYWSSGYGRHSLQERHVRVSTDNWGATKPIGGGHIHVKRRPVTVGMIQTISIHVLPSERCVSGCIAALSGRVACNAAGSQRRSTHNTLSMLKNIYMDQPHIALCQHAVPLPCVSSRNQQAAMPYVPNGSCKQCLEQCVVNMSSCVPSLLSCTPKHITPVSEGFLCPACTCMHLHAHP